MRLRQACVAVLLTALSGAAGAAEFFGEVVDSETGQAIPCRVYLQSSSGDWLFVESAAEDGSALAYREQWVPMPGSTELHTTLSAHPFRAELKPGSYTITIERGKEYLPLSAKIEIGAGKVPRRKFVLKRWINLAESGWFSGETHVHRRIQELPNVMLAEDLNVAFPVTFWTVKAGATPGLEPSTLRRQGPSPFGARQDMGSRMYAIDEQHVVFPRNTEYEVFFVGEQRHTLGAVFILNHQSIFQQGMPPVAEIAEQAHREGALLDLDKHSWPWSMMLIPIAKVDLFELSNNSVWRTNFGFRRSSTPPPEYLQLERDSNGLLTEWGWLTFGFENYYALLNCGFKIQPTAGTASGVHPVPLGYSRVYVQTGEKFAPQAWLQGLKNGRSFVSTGPVLLSTMDDQHPGHQFKSGRGQHRLRIRSLSPRPIERVEVLLNGDVIRTIQVASEDQQRTERGAYLVEQDVTVDVERTSWVAVRSRERQPDGRYRFAHTAPWHFEVAGQPIRPPRRQIEFLIRRVEGEVKRNTGKLSDEAMAEFQKALEIYREIEQRAVP